MVLETSHVKTIKTNQIHFLFFSAVDISCLDSKQKPTLSWKTLFSAVVQKYDATVSREDILLSNDVLFKCGIPSFVADFVTVVGWADSEGSNYNAQDLSALGNLLVCSHQTSKCIGLRINIVLNWTT